MRLLLITREYPPYVKGGMCRVAEYLAKGSHQHEIELTIIANHPGFGRLKERINNITIHRVSSFGSTFLTQLPSFGYYASVQVQELQKDYDIVYSNYTPLFCKIKRPFIAGFVATRYGEYIGCKETGKTGHALLNRLYIPLDKLLVKKANGIIVNSRNLVQEITIMGGEKKIIEFIPIGINTDLFKPLSSRQFTSKKKEILCVSRLDSRKGIDFVLNAFKEVIGAVEARLIIGGDGPEKQNLLKLADSLSLPVKFLGTISYEDLAKIYNEADLFVLPSFYEGLPLVALEAMACGTPTIVSDGSPDLGIPRFERGNVESLRKIILETISSEKRLEELSRQALSISQNYKWERTVEETFSFLQKFI